MAKLTPKIILEGTRLTHKTDLAFALTSTRGSWGRAATATTPR
jgi:hypothetical protein